MLRQLQKLYKSALPDSLKLGASLVIFCVLAAPVVSFGQTTEELQAQILQLIVEVERLQALLTDQGAIDLSPFCHNFAIDLKLGDRGSEVEFLQTALGREGFAIIENELAENYLGDETESAVKNFQEKYGSEILTPAGLISGNGYVGQYTRTKLDNLYMCST